MDSDSDDSDSSSSSTPPTTLPPTTKKRKTPSSSTPPPTKKSSKSKSNLSSIIDDAAVLSGSDNESEEDDYDDPNNNEYEEDDFVVGDGQEDDLEESEEEDGNASPRKKKRGKGKERKRIRKRKDTDRLLDDDLDLINEAKGVIQNYEDEDDLSEDDMGNSRSKSQNRKSQKIRQRQLANKQKNTKSKGDAYFDDDNLDDFITYDEQGTAPEDEEDRVGGPGGEISEAQINEANDIFGTDFMDAMNAGNDDNDETEKYREEGVGVDLGVGSDAEEPISSSEDESDDDDDMYGGTEGGDTDYDAIRRRKAQRKQDKLTRRKEARKARLRRAFEPVQLIENFCTDRDDEIREKDVPERYFDRYTTMDPKLDGAKAGEEGYDVEDFTEEEQEEAMWIMGRVPAIASEFFSAVTKNNGIKQQEMEDVEDEVTREKQDMERKQTSILHSIINALRYLRRDKLEPEFIRHYRADYVTSPAVREHLYTVIDEDTEWGRANGAQEKVETLLTEISEMQAVEEVIGSKEEKVKAVRERLREAQERLDESVKEEERLKIVMKEIGDNDDDEDEDELFGDDDSDNDNDGKPSKTKEQKETVQKDLNKSNTLVTVCSEQVAHLTSSLSEAEENVNSHSSEKNALELRTKMCSTKIWNVEHYKQYLRSITDYRHAMDMYTYLSLLKEGNNAIRGSTTEGKASALAEINDDTEKSKKKKRSKRSDRDFYRTCVSQGLRGICYKFVLSPYRVGIKLEDSVTKPEGFTDWDRTLPGDPGEEEHGPQAWDSPKIEHSSPSDFASELVDSGELVLLASSVIGSQPDSAMDDVPEVKDPLRGCRYVAAMEIAFEPRIRKHLRAIYRSRAVLTSRPTPKGIDTIDAFHEYYGLHLIRGKKVQDHFALDEREAEMQKVGFTLDEKLEQDEKLKRGVRDSCMQYMNLLRAAATGYLKLCVHLPFKGHTALLDSESWYKKSDHYFLTRDNQDISPLLDELEKVYLPVHNDTPEWNEERRKILTLAVQTFLLPKFEAEARRDMREASIKIAVEAAVSNLSTMTMEGPYRPSHLLGESRFLMPTGDLPIVGVCVSTDGREASYLAALTERGEMADHLAIPSGNFIDNAKMRDKVIRFLMQTRPSAIVVGTGSGLRSRQIMRRLGDIVTQALERWNNRKMQGQDEDDDEFNEREREFKRMYPLHGHDDDDEDLIWNCNVEMVDDNVAQLFGRSVRGKKEFPDTAENLKCAIATARYAKDPLSEITYTWSAASDTGVFGTEMLYLNIHPLQRILPKTILLRGYERALCRAVGEVGVDVNLACKYDHLHGLLSFVPGFGPRKAANLKQGLDRIGGVIVRLKQIIQKKLVGPVVYNNAVAFLRIRETDVLSTSILFPLDDTRLHPDNYKNAKKIALNALDRNDDGDKDNKEEFEVTAIRDIMHNSKNEVRRLYQATKAEWEQVNQSELPVGKWNPRDVKSHQWRDKVDELDLEAFAKIIEEGRKGKHLTHLNMIKEEFRLPFEDPRNPMEPLDKEKQFLLLTGESDQTMCPGKEITGKVTKNSDFGAHVRLENDIPGFIPLRNLSDGHVESADDIVQVGCIVTCIVTEVKKDHLSVDLSLKQEDVNRAPSSWKRPESLIPLDQNFDRVAAVIIETDNAQKREERFAALMPVLKTGAGSNGDIEPSRTSRVTNRACSHPAFRNAQHAEVEKELKEGGESMVGEALIRPSSKEADNLVLHWVVRLGVVKIIIVVEEDKESDVGIGSVLKIKDDAYGDIDELLARYVSPLNERVEEIMHHRKFLNMRKEDIDQKLIDFKKQNPRGVGYFLCWSDRYPGCISLRFRNNTTKSHLISISLEGYVWLKKTFPEMDLLLNYFKKYPSGQTSTSSSTRAPARPPARAPEAKPSRWGAKSNPLPPAPAARAAPPPPPAQPASNGGDGGWGQAPAAATASSGWNQPPPVLPPPPQYPNIPPPIPPGNSGWGQPQLPPPPQHNYAHPPPPRPPQH